MITALLTGFAFAHPSFQQPQDANLIPVNSVIVVSSRPLGADEIATVRMAARSGEPVEIPKLGTFRPFTIEGRRLAILSRFLLEDRYSLATRVLRRLGDIWNPGKIIQLNEAEDLREWVVQNCVPHPDGKAGHESPVFMLSVQPYLTLRLGTQTKSILAPWPERIEPQAWPIIQTPPRPRDGDDKYNVQIPEHWVIGTDEYYDAKDSGERVGLVAKAVAVWHAEQEKRLRAAAARFFAKRDTALADLFLGNLPIGRPFASISPGMRKRFEDEVSGPLRSEFGFRSKAESLAWLAKATVVSIEPQLYGFLPKYDQGRSDGVFFPIHLP